MPAAQVILDGLTGMANEWRGLAIIWHGAFAVGLIALFVGWRPTKRSAGILLALPAGSVSAMAWLSGNPFNGTVFAMITVVLVGLAMRLPRTRVNGGPAALVGVGALLAAFGWTYPHFVEAESWRTYLYAAPLGLVPCPTLSALVGLTLIADGLGSRTWSMVLAAAGIVYGLVGWLRLGVVIDVALLAGAMALAVIALVRHGRVSAAPAEAV